MGGGGGEVGWTSQALQIALAFELFLLHSFIVGRLKNSLK